MRIVIILLFCVVRGFAAPVPVDVYLDMESGSANARVTAALLNSATHGTGGSWGTFVAPDSAASSLSAMTVTTSFEPLLGAPVTVGSRLYTDQESTRGYAFRNLTDRQFARYTFDLSHPKVSMGCFLRLGNFDGSTSGSYDLITMEGEGEFAVLNFQDFPGDGFVWQIHSQAGVHDDFPVAPNTTYWVTMLWDQPLRRAFLKVYEAATWELVGSSSIVLEANRECQTVCFGRYDEHAAISPAYHYYDDLMIDYSEAHFPILPARVGPAVEQISLAIEGEGTISGAANDQFLEIDRAYTLTARPAAGNIFAGWTGSTSSPNASLKFLMASNLTFTAHFAPNPFLELKGTYAGLFYDPTNTEQRSSGYLKLTLASSGAYSAKASLNGKSHSASGVLLPDGTGTCVFQRAGTNDLVASLNLDLTNQTDRLGGFIVEQEDDAALWTAALTLNRPAFSKTSPAPSLGRYTLCILPDASSTGSPQGEGCGTLSVSALGVLSFAGTLADGTKVSQKTSLSNSGDWPLYLSLYHGKGALLCPALLDTNQPESDISGTLRWFKQAQPGASIYEDGFTNSTTVIGSRYQPWSGTNALLNLTDGTIQFSLDNLSAAFTNQIELTPENSFLNQSTNKLSLSVSKTTGRFNGSVVPPAGGKAIPFSGAVLQRQNLGAGFFIETNRSGNVLLGP